VGFLFFEGFDLLLLLVLLLEQRGMFCWCGGGLWWCVHALYMLGGKGDDRFTGVNDY
jgi:hypothetical protein